MKYLGKIQDNKDLVTKEYVDGRSGVTGVKGNSESAYRTGNVNVTPANVGAVAKSGDTMTGTLVSASNKYTADTGGEYGINMSNSDIANVNGIYTSDTAEDGREGYNFYRDATHWDSFHILNGVGYITPNRSRGAAGNKEAIITEKLKGNGTTDYTIRPLVSQTRANRLAFLPPDQVIIEKTTDGGTTWVDAGFSDDAKRKLFSYGGNGVSIPLLNNTRSTQCGLRITITGMKYNVPSGTAETSKYNYWNSNYIVSQERYFNVREWWFWISSQSDRMTCTIQAATGANPTNWVTYHNDNDFRMSGWSGSDWIRCGGGNTFGGGTTQTTNYWNWRLTFFSAYVPGNSAFTGSSAQYIYFIRCYGDSVWGQPNNLMADDHLYRIDEAMNATFPAGVTATKINGAILRNYNNTTANANDITANGFSYYTSNGPATSLGATVNDGALYSQAYSTSWVAQIAQDYRNGGLFVRGKNNGTWQSWQKVYDSAHKPSLSADVTGTLPVANGGTGATTAEGAANNIFSGLPAWTADPTDDTYFPRQDTGGSASYGKVKFSTVWNYIKGKISSVLGLTASQYGGNAKSASHLKAYSGNEVTVGANGIAAGSSSNDSVWINYRDVEGGSTSNAATKITNYYFGNRKGNVSDVTVHATSFNGTAANASKVNNLTVQTAVPANAVFTDTVTTATTSGSGNAVTAISATNGALTVTKGTTFLTSHQDISGKADKSATVSTVTWDSTNKKLTKTINGTTTDVVTAATLRTGLNVADGAEVNQNAFSNVKVGSTTVAADSKTDTLELVAGSNVTLTPDATNDKVTIAATDTTYESKAAASGGTAVSLVTTGEKYTWNNKSSLALGETSSTAYRGDRGKTAYDHSQATHARTDATAVSSSSTNGNIKINGTETTVYTHPGSGTNPHGTTKSDVGLGNVGNFKAVSTAASQGLTATEQSNARANIGAGTSSLTLGTSGTTAAYGNHNHTGVYSPVGHTHDGINIDIDNGGSYIPVSNIEAGDNVTLDYNNQTDTLTINATGGGGGTTDYSNLSNKPQINSNTLSGNKTSADLGLQSALSVESQTLAVSSSFTLYSSSPYTTTDATITLRRYGRVASVTGMVKPKTAITGSDTEYTICTVPTGYRPSQPIIQLMQGSTQYHWCLKVNTDGRVTFSRYSATTSYAQASTSAWLPFHATWIIG